jgi:hypothetical protein
MSKKEDPRKHNYLLLLSMKYISKYIDRTNHHIDDLAAP